MVMTGLSRIHQLSMRVHDVDRAVRFYRDALGLAFLFAAPPRMAFFDCGGVRLMLSEPEPGQDAKVGGSDCVLYFKVSEIRSAHATLAARGVPFVDEPHLVARMPDHELWMCFLKDPDEHLIGLMCEVRG